MLPPLTIFIGFVLPGLLVAAGLAFAWKIWDGKSSVDGRWVGGPLIGAAFALAFWKIRAMPSFTPGSGGVVYWLFYFSIILGLLGFFDAIFRPPTWLRAVLLILLWRLAIRTLLWPLIPQTISQTAAEMWIDAACLAGLVSWLCMETVAENNPGVTAPILLLILSIGSTVFLLSWHVEVSAKVAMGMAVICGAATVASIFRGRISLSRGGVAVIVLLLQGPLLHGFFYTDDDLTLSQQIAFGLFMFSPILAFAGDWPGIRKMHRGWRLAARILLLLAVVGAAAGISMRAAASAEQNQSSEQGM
jgi:hypothetical protein